MWKGTFFVLLTPWARALCLHSVKLHKRRCTFYFLSWDRWYNFSIIRDILTQRWFHLIWISPSVLLRNILSVSYHISLLKSDRRERFFYHGKYFSFDISQYSWLLGAQCESVQRPLLLFTFQQNELTVALPKHLSTQPIQFL